MFWSFLTWNMSSHQKKIASTCSSNFLVGFAHACVTSCGFPCIFSRLTQEARLREAVLTEVDLAWGGGKGVKGCEIDTPLEV